MPIPVAEQRLREFLLLYEQEPQVSIEPLFRVIVTGEVNAPSVYEFGPEVTLGRAISLAGGVTQRGQLSRVSLVRNGVRSSLDMRRAEQSQLAIRSGDQIVVRRRLNPVQDILFPAGGILLAVHQLYSGARALFGF